MLKLIAGITFGCGVVFALLIGLNRALDGVHFRPEFYSTSAQVIPTVLLVLVFGRRREELTPLAGGASVGMATAAFFGLVGAVIGTAVGDTGNACAQLVITGYIGLGVATFAAMLREIARIPVSPK